MKHNSLSIRLQASLLPALLLAALLIPASGAHAENGRDFAGEYRLSDIVESGGTVNAMLTVRIFNYSGGDIWGATVLLGAQGQTVVADNIGFANHASQLIRVPVSVPSADYATWKNTLPLSVKWTRTDGTQGSRPVEMHRGTATLGGVQ